MQDRRSTSRIMVLMIDQWSTAKCQKITKSRSAGFSGALTRWQHKCQKITKFSFR